MLSIKIPTVENSKVQLPKKAVPDVIKGLIKSSVEATSDFNQSSIDLHFHPFLNSAHNAFDEHLPFVISPDMLWLAIAQGFSQHINMNAEKYRSRFVSHEGKVAIHVIRNDFVRLSPTNPWEEVFSAFTSQIASYIGEEKYKLVVEKFSTTTPTTTAAFEVTLMDAMQSYFEIHFHTCCGIPEVFVEGTKEDYQKILKKLDEISTFDLEWWTDKLKDILNQIIKSFDGSIDLDFWKSLYKIGGGSGGPFVDGWLISFIPYVKNYENKFFKNPILDGAQRSRLTTDSFTSGLSQTPFVWHYINNDFNYEFIAGFTGATQDSSNGAIRPTIGWAIREKKK